MVLLLSALDRVGFGGPGVAAAVVIAGGAAAVPAVLVTVRELAGESWARRAGAVRRAGAAALWVASSADALFAGVGAWAVALVVLGTGRGDLRGEAYALAGGLLFGAVAFLSYGLVLLALVPLLVACRRRRWRPLGLAALGAMPVFAIFAAAGFSWFAGLLATRDRYFAGVASRRPYAEFLVINLAALGIALGPACAVGLARLRDLRVALLVGGALAAVGVALLSGMSKGEVERIWLPFAVFVLPASAVLVGARAARTRAWLALQCATGIGVASFVRTSW